MVDLSSFEHYCNLAESLIEQSTKEQIAECARVLALNLAHHQSIHGEVPLEETLALLDASEPNEAQLQLLTGGMENLIGVLGNISK